MASKEDKEAALNAKIAAIRAANKATEKRHQEIVADRLLAEKTKSSITLKEDETKEDNGGPVDGTPDRFKSPFPDKASKRPVHERIASKSSPREAEPARRRAGRLADDDGPPPDPGYSFLADRMRDGSDDEDENNRSPKTSDASKFPSRSKKPEPDWGKRSAGPGARDRPRHQDENVSPQHRMNRTVAQNIREIRDETSRVNSRPTSHIRPLMPEQQMQRNSSAAFNKPSGSQARLSGAQARLDRSRSHPIQGSLNQPLNQENGNDNPHRKVIESGKKNITVKVDFDRTDDEQPSSGIGHLKTDQPPPPLAAQVQEPPVAPPPELRQPLQNTPLVVSAPSFVPSQDHNSQWQPMPINQWDPQSQAAQPQSQMVMGHWDPANQGMVQPQWTQPVQPMADWSGAAAAGGPQDYQQMHHHTDQQAALYHQQQYMHIPFQDTANPTMMIPIGSHPDYMTQPPLVHHHGHQAMTQITHATMPIMASQQYIPPAAHKPEYYGRGFSRPSSNGGSSAHTSSRVPSDRSHYSWRNPEKEVTRIPPRFQKQRPSANQHQASEKVFSALPRATSRTAPSTAKQLTIFGTSNVVNNLNESELGEDLSIPVRLIAAMKLGDFKEKIAMVDPEKDRLILIHSLGNDARNIALKHSKNDVDKGAESDGLANEFADVVLDLVERIPYIKVLISTLLPRFDSEDQMNMSNPNNVRKVMNVEISMRLQDKPNIEFINNDTVLEWWKDDVKKLRLFRPDGYHLSAYGFSMMLEQWMKTLKLSVAQLGLTASDNDDSTSPDADENDIPVIPRVPSPKQTSIRSSSEKEPNSAEKEPNSTEKEPNGTNNTTTELPVSDNELPNLEEVTPKIAQVSLEEANDIPLPTVTSDDDEFHEASESPDELQPTDAPMKPSEEEEFKEKSNEEKMEKEMKNNDEEID